MSVTSSKPDEPFDAIVAQLHSSDWLIRGVAIRKLVPYLDRALPCLPRLFEITFDELAPLRSDSTALIKRIGEGATPWLLKKLADGEAAARARAIELIASFHKGEFYRLIDQWLPERNTTLPNWAGSGAHVKTALTNALRDSDLNVRFAAASACEEFGWSLPDTVPVFIEALYSMNEHTQNLAALRLGRIGPMAVGGVEALRPLTQSANRYVRRAARNAIERICRT